MKKKDKLILDRFESRRQFLYQAGSLLILPHLTSLMPQSVAAQVMGAKKVRSIIYVGSLGIDSNRMFPGPLPTPKVAPGTSDMKYKLLNEFSGPISQVIDESFIDLYPNMLLMKGLSHSSGVPAAHNTGPLSATKSRTPDDGATIDTIMEKSSAIYGDSNATVRALRIGTYYKSNNFSWQAVNGTALKNNIILGDRGIFNTLFGGMEDNPNGEKQRANKLVVDRVYDDLKKLENNKRLSKEDKLLLERYVSSIFELQKNIQANASISCTKPSLALEQTGGGRGSQFPNDSGWGIKSNDNLFQNINEMIKVAFLCDLTRVVYIHNRIWQDAPVSPRVLGGLHHKCPGSVEAARRQQYGIKKMGDLARVLRATSDPLGSGTLLDNSSILCTNELGSWTGSHSVTCMPTLLFGKGGGYFNTGHYIDCTRSETGKLYRGPYGRPYKQLLQSVMLSMGVPEAEYRRYRKDGNFGDFRKDINFNKRFIEDVFTPYINEHNGPLPFVTNT